MNKKQQREEILFKTRNAVRLLCFGEYQETNIDLEPYENPTYNAMTYARWLCEGLYRIERTLHRWHELQCGTDQGCIEQDESTGKWIMRTEYNGKEYKRPVADRETGAKRRLAKLIEPYAETCAAYIQTDPRGAALYLYDPRKYTAQEIDSNYSSSTCICNRF